MLTLPENIGKYSHIILQELGRPDRNPADILMAWIIAWAYAEKTELLARQIMRQIKEQFPEDFQQAYEQCIKRLANKSFKQNAVKAFNLAITKYRIREDIKLVAYDAPTERVLEALNQISSMSPQSMHLNKLIKDVEDIIRIKSGAPPTIPAAQPSTISAPAQQRPTQPLPAQPMPTARPTPAPQPTVRRKTATTVSPRVPQQPVGLDKSTMEEVINNAIGNKLELVEEVASSVNTLTQRLESMSSEIQEIRGLLDKISSDINRLESQIREIPTKPAEPIQPIKFGRAKVSKSTIDVFKNALEFIGLKLDDKLLSKYISIEEVEHPPKPPAPPKVPTKKPVEIPVEKPVVEKPREAVAEKPAPPPPPPKEIPVKEELPVPTPPPKPTPTHPPTEPEVVVGAKEIPPIPSPAEAIGKIPSPKEIALAPPEKPKVKEAREMSIYITALGDLRKLTEMLAKFKDKAKPFRWNISVNIGSTKYNITIQGAVRGIPRSLQREIARKTNGFLVIGAFTKDIIASTLKLMRIVKKVDFVIWCDETVPDEVKAMQVPIEAGLIGTRNDLFDLFKRALFKAYEA